MLITPSLPLPLLALIHPITHPAIGVGSGPPSRTISSPPLSGRATSHGAALSILSNRRVQSTHLAHATAGGKVDGYPACTEIPSQVARWVPSHQPRAGAPSPVLSRGLSFSVGPRLLCHSSFSGRPFNKMRLGRVGFPFLPVLPLLSLQDW